MECLVIIGAIIAREDSGLRIHGFVVFEILDFFADFFVTVAMESTAEDDADTDSNEDDGEGCLPSYIVGEDILSSEEENDAGGERAEAHEFLFFGKEVDNAWDDDEEGPPAVEEDVEIKKSEGVATEDDAKCDDGNPPDDWFSLFHFITPLKMIIAQDGNCFAVRLD